jgi:outer membrane protein assembly factor BamB
MASPTLSVDESIIYVGSGDPNKDNGGSLYAINSDGTLRWKYEGLSSMRVSGPVVGPNGRIYACASSRVYCFSSSGSLIWQSDNDTAGNLCPALSSQEVVYVGTAQGKIFALNASNGSTLWSYQTGANPDYDPDNPHDPEYGVLTAPICGADGVVYVGAVDGKMYALNVDGSLLWTYETGDSIVENCPAIGPDGALYFISEDGYAYCVKD